MSMLEKLPSSLEEIEQSLISSVGWRSILDLEIDALQIPDIRSTPMLEASLMQWLATKWINTPKHSVQNLSGDNSFNVETLTNTYAGTFLLLFPPNKIPKSKRSEWIISCKKYLTQQEQWPDLAQMPDLKYMNAVLLAVSDRHPGQIPSLLYGNDNLNTNDFPVERFEFLTKEILGRIISNDILMPTSLQKSHSITRIIFELFKNTHQHARHDISGGIIPHSTRAVYARFYPREVLSNRASKDSISPLDIYIRQKFNPLAVKSRKSTSPITGLLEISIIDTGPGLSGRWLAMGKTVDIQDEFKALIECFSKWRTSTKTPGKGYGLYDVLKTLISLEGFIRVRTNRLNVYRPLNYGIKKTGDGNPAEELLDWAKGLTAKASAFGEVSGTLISILIPTE